MKKQHPKRNIFLGLFLALLFFFPFSSAQACDTSGFIIDNLINNGDGTYTIQMTILVAGGNTTGVGSTYGFYWDIDVPVLSVAPTSLTSSNGTTINAVISGNNITWGDPNPSGLTPFLDIFASPNDESFQVTIIVDGLPTEWSGGGQEANVCPGVSSGAIPANYAGEFPCEPGAPTPLTLQTCDGGMVDYEGLTLSVGSVTDVVLTAVDGCDSVVTVTVVGTGPLVGAETLQACQGQPVIYQGVEVAPGTSMDFMLTSIEGCDSVVTVTVLEPTPPTIGSATVQACEGETLTYNGVEIFPGSVTEFILTNAHGCDSIVMVTALEPLPRASGSDTLGLCLGASINIFGQTITEPGIYSETYVAFNGCDSVHTAFVQLEPGPPLEMPESTEIDLGCELVLQPIIGQLGQVSYQWAPDPSLSCPEGGTDCPMPSVQPLNNTIYSLTVTDSEGCTSEGTVEILVNKKRRIFIPNTFSPNGDGINDSFLVFSDRKSVARVNAFRVFSRWGELVFEGYDLTPNDVNSGWDGTFLGEEMDASIFVYAADVEFVDGEILRYKGDILLVK